jgi:hypothetical protein
MHGKHVPFERSFSLRDARRGIEHWLTTRGLTWEISVAGVRVHAAKCVLHNREGVEASIGLGKGSEDESIVGALFEAAEHLCSDFDVLSEPTLRYLSSDELKIDDARLSIVLRSMLNAAAKARLPYQVHQSILGDEAVCDYPVALFHPSYVDGVLDGSILNPRDNFDYDRLGLYSSNSGIAIGMNRTESIIHGVLESIERDTIARFLVRAFLLRDASSVRRVEVEALPADLRRLQENIQFEASADVHIYEISGRFDVPVFCTWIDRNEDLFYPRGFGCSLCSVHAIRRSLNEATQAYFSVNVLQDRDSFLKGYRTRLRKLKSLPFHHRCAVFDMGALSREIPMTSLRRVPSNSDWTASRAKNYLRAIASKIKAAGQAAFYASIVKGSAGEMAVTHSFTSEQDHFFTVLNGLPSMPSSLFLSADQTTSGNALNPDHEPKLFSRDKGTSSCGC